MDDEQPTIREANKICGVCGDRALGYNFNAVSCESCKAFFRRNALKDKDFRCPFTENCNVTPVTRRFCQKCRLDKCFSIGMRKEYIMTEEDKVLKRHKIEQNRAKKRPPSASPKVVKMKREIIDDSFDTETSISVASVVSRTSATSDGYFWESDKRYADLDSANSKQQPTIENMSPATAASVPSPSSPPENRDIVGSQTLEMLKDTTRNYCFGNVEKGTRKIVDIGENVISGKRKYERNDNVAFGGFNGKSVITRACDSISTEITAEPSTSARNSEVELTPIIYTDYISENYGESPISTRFANENSTSDVSRKAKETISPKGSELIAKLTQDPGLVVKFLSNPNLVAKIFQDKSLIMKIMTDPNTVTRLASDPQISQFFEENRQDFNENSKKERNYSTEFLKENRENSSDDLKKEINYSTEFLEENREKSSDNSKNERNYSMEFLEENRQKSSDNSEKERNYSTEFLEENREKLNEISKKERNYSTEFLEKNRQKLSEDSKNSMEFLEENEQQKSSDNSKKERNYSTEFLEENRENSKKNRNYSTEFLEENRQKLSDNSKKNRNYSTEFSEKNQQNSSDNSKKQRNDSTESLENNGISDNMIRDMLEGEELKNRVENPILTNLITTRKIESFDTKVEEEFGDKTANGKSSNGDWIKNNSDDVTRDVLQDVERIPIIANSIESILCEAIKLEFSAYSSLGGHQNSRELNDAERAKLNELIVANKALLAPLDDDITNLVGEECRFKGNAGHSDPMLLDVINLTAIAIRRLIKMSKKINAFKNMCQEDQLALLKGGCTEMMILRSALNYDPDKDMWKIPHSQERMSKIKVDVLKEAKGNLYAEHSRFVRTFDPRWRDENIILILSAIALFSPDRPRVVHSDVIRLEQSSYYYLLRRYLESVYPGCEAKSTFLKLIQKISELHRLNDEVVGVYLNVNPSSVEPLLIEIFDLKH